MRLEGIDGIRAELQAVGDGRPACSFRGGNSCAFLVKLALFASVWSRARLAGEIVKIGRRLGCGVLLNIDREADSEKTSQCADSELDQAFDCLWYGACCHCVYGFCWRLTVGLCCFPDRRDAESRSRPRLG